MTNIAVHQLSLDSLELNLVKMSRKDFYIINNFKIKLKQSGDKLFFNPGCSYELYT